MDDFLQVMSFIVGVAGLVFKLAGSGNDAPAAKQYTVTATLYVDKIIIKKLDLALGEKLALDTVPGTVEVRVLAKGAEIGIIEDAELHFRVRSNLARARVASFDDYTVTVELIY